MLIYYKCVFFLKYLCYNKNSMDKLLKKYIKENYIKPKPQKKSFEYSKKRNQQNRQSAYNNTNIYLVDSLKCYSIDFEQNLQETFVQHLFEIIDQKNLKDSQVYKKANIDRKLFSKIRSNVNYTPSKNTLLALAVALELDLEQTKVFLEKAGYSLSKSILTDVIVEYYIVNKQYDIFTINQSLDDYKLQILGSNA